MCCCCEYIKVSIYGICESVVGDEIVNVRNIGYCECFDVIGNGFKGGIVEFMWVGGMFV